MRAILVPGACALSWNDATSSTAGSGAHEGAAVENALLRGRDEVVLR